jgi:tetratricopeptide (TPR) repeat protein
MLPDDVLVATALPNEALLATHLRALGGVWRLRGDFSRAMRAHQRAIEIFERVYGSDHTDVGRALDSLGRVQREWGDLEGALKSFNRAEEISDLQFGSNYPHAGTAAVNRALVYLESSEALRALEEAEKGLQIYRLAYDEKHNDKSGGPLRNESTVWALFVRANALADLGELQRAQEDHQVVLDWRQDRYPRLHAQTASSHYALGDVLWKIGSEHLKQRGLWHHRQALAIREQVFDKRPDYWLAQSQARLGGLTNDGELLHRAYDTYNQQLRPDHWRTREVAAAIKELG